MGAGRNATNGLPRVAPLWRAVTGCRIRVASRSARTATAAVQGAPEPIRLAVAVKQIAEHFVERGLRILEFLQRGVESLQCDL
ncbi:hypothetical protein LMG29542_04568 [Paraburkholderia humisilvae]|uniref:Uncharacterized protein n=1 Tax=Paraburkholderia humisilvae TaxID=627669 RepID=A0A6J5EAH5_9BURK|nr:hypothetical protein LMG29542_04568 [Paraburkholderia humisilvae]